MGLFERMHAGNGKPTERAIRRIRSSAFRMVRDPDVRHGLLLSFERPGTTNQIALWSGAFSSRAECQAVLDAANKHRANLEFWGRLALAMGSEALERIIESVAAEARKNAREEVERRRKEAAARRTINLYARERGGRFYLDLQRASADSPEWSIRFDGRSERDRMCDWLRWQKAHFRAYLAFAAAYGDHALEKRLIDEMFEAEARLKKEGRTAGGLRPLRMWRGE